MIIKPKKGFSMQFSQVVRELKIPESNIEAVGGNWEKSAASFPGTCPEFCRLSYFGQYREMAGIAPEVTPLVAEVVNLVEASPAAQMLAWHAHQVLCVYGVSEINFREWPEFEEFFGKNAGIFYLLIGMSAIPVWFKTYEKLGVPESYAHDCCKWLGGTIQIYQAVHDNIQGLNLKHLHWIRWYIEGRLFRIGRLEYMKHELNKSYPHVYRHKVTGKVLALCSPGILLDKTGQCIYQDQPDSDAYKVTELKETPESITGTPVFPFGYALPDRHVTLKFSEWEKVLAHGDPVADLHIPTGGGMTLEACRDSFVRAKDFFREHLLDFKPNAFVCCSWIFNTQFEEMLPDSNLTKFMQQLYLLPWRSSGKDGMFFIFGRDDGNWREYPRDNSIRRTMLDILESGRRLRLQGMFYLFDDIPQFGTEYYRNNWQHNKPEEV